MRIARVPDEILADYKNATDVYDRTLAGLGNFSEVTAGILAGEAGYVHVGMDKGYDRREKSRGRRGFNAVAGHAAAQMTSIMNRR
jgi:hypothetical protein